MNDIERDTERNINVKNGKKPKPERRLIIDRGILLDYWGRDRILEIPHGVKKLGNYSAWGLDCIKKVTIPETVKKIERGAFSMCFGLREIDLKNVRKIGESAFNDCRHLKKIVIPEGVTKIDKWTFYGCKRLKEVVLPSTLKYIGECAFEGCKRLKKIEFPLGLQEIDEYAFEDCKNLKTVYIPCTVKIIGKACFGGSRLKSIELPDTCKVPNDRFSAFERARVTRYSYKGAPIETADELPIFDIKDGALIDYDGDDNTVTVPDGVTEIGELAFDDSEVRKVILPNSVKIIADDAFVDSTHLTEINLPDGLQRLGAGAFQNCKKLKRITIPNGIIAIEEFAFSGCEALEEVVLPDSIIKIENHAFNRCKKLTMPKIPNGATVDKTAFKGCRCY